MKLIIDDRTRKPLLDALLDLLDYQMDAGPLHWPESQSYSADDKKLHKRKIKRTERLIERIGGTP